MANSRARETTEAIERLYVSMRHLFYRGFFKPSGVSGESLRKLLMIINPEIYGSMSVPNKIELDGLLYVLDRLPEGIEECSFIHLTSDEGFDKGSFEPIVPKKRRRNCYRIDEHQMNIEVLLGRSEIYDILTHLTFLYLEADKIRNIGFDLDNEGRPKRIWKIIEEVAKGEKKYSRKEKEVALIHLSSFLGRTFDETLNAYNNFGDDKNPDRLFKIIYWLGQISLEDWKELREREIYFSAILQERVGHHLFGEKWANKIKQVLVENNLHMRPLHIISANMHSVKNMVFANDALNKKGTKEVDYKLFADISNKKELQEKVLDHALKEGMIYIDDNSGSNIDVQIIDLAKTELKNTVFANQKYKGDDVILVFDYAFGEQAFEVMDELLRPYEVKGEVYMMKVKSVSIMGKAGILTGGKGDIMIPTSHIFEGTADNYVFENALKATDFVDDEIKSFEGPMITVLGTSLQNKDILSYFMTTSWKAIGLEMEGAHYQKAIQVASKIRHHISPDLFVMYAYYASDNPLETGSTLSSGGLGLTGVKPTYMITHKIIEKILEKK
ncbi:MULTISPECIES: DUF6909 family protein [Epilithonimonas]|uniref:Uncharacterized protein n=2 Tax=Epilithonimonas TaxID=2782229 RepID=A0A420DDK0_9FLAO|nr:MULTISPECIES: hypothetical protein [Epilithonimonas]OJX32892.1 MAG: hypothetical protein BGO86_12960 [Chryseobacterium sp. 36-9]RKE89649.1 hypothetical protein BXY58_0220 [Epilithonimonas arachidiradicis]GGG44214.1 hypothetical protein GCM10007332_02070 [Epilithonimonas arachidiradicis]SMP90178.1 hypothetical protein SAMN05421679_102206 [Epilithonimonas pallida]